MVLSPLSIILFCPRDRKIAHILSQALPSRVLLGAEAVRDVGQEGRDASGGRDKWAVTFPGVWRGQQCMISKGSAEDFGDSNWRRGYEQPFSSCKCEVTEKEGFKVR